MVRIASNSVEKWYTGDLSMILKRIISLGKQRLRDIECKKGS